MVAAFDVNACAGVSDLSGAGFDVSASHKECVQLGQDLVPSISQALSGAISASDNRTLADTFYGSSSELDGCLSFSNSLDLSCSSSSIDISSSSPTPGDTSSADNPALELSPTPTNCPPINSDSTKKLKENKCMYYKCVQDGYVSCQIPSNHVSWRL
jgi:hypothetical protein